MVSPYSPLTAYLAVSLQGVFGFFLFSTKKFYKSSSLPLGLLVVFFSGIQKIIVLTILFGNTLWNSIDIFIKQISVEILNIDHPDINYSYLLIFGYVLIHLIAGLFIGIYAGKLPQKLEYYRSIIPAVSELQNGEQIPQNRKRKKKSWFFRPTGIFIIIISVGVILLSYFSPELEDNIALSVIFMLVRSIIITFVWYTLITPIVKNIFQRFVSKRKSEYSKDLENIISMFPQFKNIINFCWKKSTNEKGLKRVHQFLSTSFYYLLLSN